MIRRLFFATLIGVAMFSLISRLGAESDDHIDSALGVAKTWMAQIDAGQYEESYAFGCTALHEKIDVNKWGVVLKALRPAWGPVVSRHVVSHIYKPDGVEGLSGECMVITYDTSFQKLNQAMEVVVLKWEDGKWLGAGYNAGPKPVAPGEEQPPEPSATETTTTMEKLPNK